MQHLLTLSRHCAQEARFDRHFVRDLTWSRHQLEELAERRFVAAQRAALRTNTSAASDGYIDPPSSDVLGASFTDLFKKVCLLIAFGSCFSPFAGFVGGMHVQ